MKQVAGIYLPDDEAHMPDYLQSSGGVYQPRQLNRSLEFVTTWDTAVDIGAHVGMWSKFLVQRFSRVIAFEPMPQMRACLERNVVSNRLHVVPLALGNEHGAVSFNYDEAHTGATHVDAMQEGLIPLGKLDDFKLKNVGYIKIDTEGFELNVLEGAKQTLIANMPVIIVEDKFHGVKHYGQKPYASIEFLESIGASVLERVVDDFIVGWPNVAGKVRNVASMKLEQEFVQHVSRHQSGDIHGARIGYRKLLRENPGHGEVLNMLAICEMQLGKIGAAIEYGLQAMETHPAEARYQNTLATCLWMAGKRDEAIDVLQRAVQIDPRLVEAHTNLGEMLEARKDYNGAAACFQQALAINPSQPVALARLGRLHAAHGSAQQASTLFRQALALQPDNKIAQQGIAQLSRAS
ncbi:MAG: FkbM family methyltransferase [Planctomycetota bacterium]|nr:FkbM family methyltransferase [Planctomycetota bacterium]